MTADPNIDFIFTSSDFLFPTIQSRAGAAGQVEEGGRRGPRHPRRARRRRWRLQADPGGLRRLDRRAGRLSRGRSSRSTGILEAIKAKEDPRPNAVKLDPGFALSQANYRRKGRQDLGLPGSRRQEIAISKDFAAGASDCRRYCRDGQTGSIQGGGRRREGRRHRADRLSCRSMPATSRQRCGRCRVDGCGSLRRLLLSDYFILYLTVAYFARDGGLLSRPRRAAQHHQPALQRLAASGRRHRPDVRHHHRGDRSSLGRHHGICQRRRRAHHDDRREPKLLLGGSPLWGTRADRTRRPARRQCLPAAGWPSP